MVWTASSSTGALVAAGSFQPQKLGYKKICFNLDSHSNQIDHELVPSPMFVKKWCSPSSKDRFKHKISICKFIANWNYQVSTLKVETNQSLNDRTIG
jgi:hypothetical protein